MNYQLLVAEDIPAAVKESAGLEEDLHQVDNLWGYLRGVKKTGTNSYDLDLFKVAKVIMTIPHSNAEERIFSLSNKNKTPSRSSLKLDGTIMTNKSLMLSGYPLLVFDTPMTFKYLIS